MPTLKSTRAAPARLLSDYVFTKSVSQDIRLSNVAASAMTQIPGLVGTGYIDDQSSSILEIGFDFVINNTTYKQFAVDTNGWILLVDPTTTPAVSDVISGGTGENDTIKRPFTANHILLCPWFDDLMNRTNVLNDIYGGGPEETAAARGISYDSRIISYDSVKYGIKYHVGYDEYGCRRLVVRWFSHSYFDIEISDYSIITFEVVLYENGAIEYRYAPMIAYGSGVHQNAAATCGIFARDTTQFRDLAGACGYMGGSKVRAEASVGGYTYDAAYTDSPSSTVYAVTLQPHIHWPAGPVGSTAHAIFRLAPPVNRKKELPRNVIREKDAQRTRSTIARTGGNSRSNGTKISLFNDQKTITYTSGTLISLPSGLPVRFNGGSQESHLYNNLYLSGGININIRPNSNTSDQYVTQNVQKKIAPFTDSGHPEQNNILIQYYGTGSNITEFGDSLSYPLQSKTQIKLSLPVSKTTTMLEQSSSIYYYNRSHNSWLVPLNALGSKDLANPLAAIGNWYTEDARGFGPLGNVISSGSRNLSTNTQTSPNWGTYVDARYSEYKSIAMGVEYAKSIQINPEYSPSPSEIFTLPITQPFLIEKAVIELPIQAGPGWFNDKTTCGHQVVNADGSPEISVSSFDFAGPAITVALFNNRNSQDKSFNDLILTGTIIPVGDSHNNVKCVYIASNHLMVTPEGFTAFNATPAAVVTPGFDNTFTGSVTLQTTAAVSNGIMAVFSNGVQSVLGGTQRQILTSEYIDANDTSNPQSIYSVNPFGRSSRGFDASGRSVFGKEFVTFESTSDGLIANPLYVSASFSDFPTDLKNAFNDAAVDYIRLYTILPLDAAKTSPYLVMPGDKLYLSLSKMRPFIYSDGIQLIAGTTENFTGSLRHDVILQTGSINITFYGSLLRENHEFHNGLSQELVTDSVYESIGSEPVVDQHDVEYRGQYVGGMFDDYVTGSMIGQIIVDSKKQIVTGSRGRVFSIYSAKLQPTPEAKLYGTSSYEVLTNPYKSFRLQPWYERCGNQRHTQLTTNNERFWDSMLPNLQECLRVDGTHLGGASYSGTGAQYWPFPRAVALPNDKGEFASVLFDVTPVALTAGAAAMMNNSWTRSYPFEPRYAGIARQSTIDKVTSMTCDNLYSDFVYDVATPIAPTRVKTFVPCFVGNVPGLVSIAATYTNETMTSWNFASDVNLSSHTVVTSSTYGFETVTPPALPTTEASPMISWATSGDTEWGSVSTGSAYAGAQCLTTDLLNLGAGDEYSTLQFSYTSPCVFKVSNMQKISGGPNDLIQFWYTNNDSGKSVPITNTTTGNSDWVSKETSLLESGSYTFFWRYYRGLVSGNESKAFFDTVTIHNYSPATGSMTQEDLTRVMYGFGDLNTLAYEDIAAPGATYGTNHLVNFRNIHNDVWPKTPSINSCWMYSPIVRGWKYGLSSGLPEFSKVIYRQQSYGQFRDMLEQRLYTKFYQQATDDGKPSAAVLDAVVTVKFVDQNGNTTPPERTWSCNLSSESTSSMPYLDGVLRNRPEINVLNLNLNTSVISFT